MRSYSKGDILRLGGYDWRVLDVEGGIALVISEAIIVKKEYGSSSAWQDSDIRRYLNGDFLDETFSPDEKALILDARKITNGDSDKIFLLSIEELLRFFGDSGEYLLGSKYISDEFNSARVALDAENGTASWWFLRMPGNPENLAQCVGDDGCIYVKEHGITTEKAGAGGIRPAMRIKSVL